MYISTFIDVNFYFCKYKLYRDKLNYLLWFVGRKKTEFFNIFLDIVKCFFFFMIIYRNFEKNQTPPPPLHHFFGPSLNIWAMTEKHSCRAAADQSGDWIIEKTKKTSTVHSNWNGGQFKTFTTHLGIFSGEGKTFFAFSMHDNRSRVGVRNTDIVTLS